MPKFPHFTQFDAMDCGPTCLQMVAKHHGKNYAIQKLRDLSHITREGVSMLGISDAAEAIGYRSMGVRITFEQLANEAPLPCIAHWNQRHFVVVHKVEKTKKAYAVHVADPAQSLLTYTEEEFMKSWASTMKDGERKGLCLLLEPTPDFYASEDDKPDKTSLQFLFSYLKPHRKLITQLILGMFVGSILQLIFPFLTQSIVDYGISNQNLNFIQLVLVAQLILFAAQTIVDFIRGWILLHLGTRVNISLISDFLIKLMRLPIKFFDTKMVGDIIQRINDHRRIELFLTSSSLNIVFGIINILVFGIILAIYSLKIFALFAIGSTLYFLWVNIFMKRRRSLDQKRFAQLSGNQSNIIQLITGMQEIKLNNCETQKRWEWERIQAQLFKVNVKSLALNQYQQSGAVFFNQTKNILITFLAATAVLKGEMTLGMMMAVQYIIGMLNSPIDQMIGFMHQWQDAKLSLERMGEIHKKENEEEPDAARLEVLPEDKTIHIENLAFQYEGPHSPFVLKDINIEIPHHKITAIVGTSGSGKTTLLKLLLNFYAPISGSIKINGMFLNQISQRLWRSKTGVVMQDGYIFSDTIANNIALGDEYVDTERLLYAVKTANIQDFVESLPLAYNTKIGNEGVGISQGQKQRILIARAVYKNPEFIFFDEATNALDANNEKVIMDNLNEFFKGKTVVVVAHRLSTVKNADQIIVLEKGKLIEKGTHKKLVKKKGAYYELVKNQLELGN